MIRGSTAAFLAGLAVMGLTGGARADEPAPFRVCMDPDNPPFSSDKPDAPGLYSEIGARIAQEIGRPFEPVWTLSYFGKRSVRTTLLDKKCDAYIGLPETDDFMGPRLLMSHPILSLGYALVLPAGRTVSALSDLDGLRVAVQFASPPESMISERDAIHPFTVRETGEAMEALTSGKADVAFIWGPTAGYINKTELHGAWKIVPVHGKNMQWQSAIGFPAGQPALRDQVDAALSKLSGDIAALEEKYGFPTASAATVDLASLGFGQARVQLAAAVADAPAAEAAAPEGQAIDAAAAAEGHELFNLNCSHCHGPDAVQSERRINLRLLQHRYGDKMDEVFTYTVHHGRTDKGMPNWTGAISDEDLDKIKAFLHSVQS